MISHCILLSTIGYLFTSFSAQGDWKIYALQLPKLLDKLPNSTCHTFQGGVIEKKCGTRFHYPGGHLRGDGVESWLFPSYFISSATEHLSLGLVQLSAATVGLANWLLYPY